jgi:hypothetical protein
MLGNNADAFFTTPMRTSIVSGGNAANALAGGMPAPYGGMPFGEDTAPAATAAAVQTETKKFLGFSVPVIIGIAAVAFMMFKR